MATFVVQMKFAVRMKCALQLSFDVFDATIFVLGDVHRHGLAIGLAGDAQDDLRRWDREGHLVAGDKRVRCSTRQLLNFVFYYRPANSEEQMSKYEVTATNVISSTKKRSGIMLLTKVLVKMQRTDEIDE